MTLALRSQTLAPANSRSSRSWETEVKVSLVDTGIVKLLSGFFERTQTNPNEQNYLSSAFVSGTLYIGNNTEKKVQLEELPSLYTRAQEVGVNDENLVELLIEGFREVFNSLGTSAIYDIRDCVVALKDHNDEFVKHAIEAISALDNVSVKDTILRIAEQTALANSVSVRFTTLRALESLPREEAAFLIEYFASLETVAWIRKYATLVLNGPRAYLWES